MKFMIPEIFNLGEEKAKNWRIGRNIGYLGAVAIVGFSASISAPYTIPIDSVGIVQRFGAYVRTEKPGFHLKWPRPVEKITKVPVTKVFIDEFGFRTLEAGVTSTFVNVENVNSIDKSVLHNIVEESGEIPQGDAELPGQVKKMLRDEYLVLTGDLNMGDCEWSVQWRVSNPYDFNFSIREPRLALRDASIALLKESTGNGSVDELITSGRENYQSEVKNKLQKVLDSYHSGIEVIALRFQSTAPPARVRPSFSDVNTATQDREKSINEARKEYNQQVTEARGDAIKALEESKGYYAERVNLAKGNVARFAQTLEAFYANPEVMTRRMYFETMEDVLGRVENKQIIDQKGMDSGLLLKLDIDRPAIQSTTKGEGK